MSPHNPRWDDILRILQSEQRVSVADLAQRFEVSEVTIRKDLGLMEGRGLLLRTHGGAVLAEDSPAVVGFKEKSNLYLAEKQQIARKALGLIRPGHNVLLDSGTTCLTLAQMLRSLDVQVITNSLSSASVLACSDTATMVVLGGTYRPVMSAIIGQSAVDQLRSYNADIAFLGASGATPEAGFSCQNLLEAQIKRAMIQQAATRVVLMDSSKFGVNKFASFATFADIHYVITDDRLSPLHREALMLAGVKVL